MTKKLTYIIFVLSVSAVLQLLNSCKKERMNMPSGTYTGTLDVIQINGNTSYNVEITFNNDNFSLKGDYANSGKFKKISKDKLVFTSKDGISDTNVDANLILNGTYSYSIAGDELFLRKDLEATIAIYPPISYEYELKKLK